MPYDQKRFWATLSVVAAVPMCLAACGSSLKSTLRHDFNKQMASGNKKLMKKGNATPVQYCRPTTLSHYMITSAGMYFGTPRSSQVNRLTGPNVHKVVGTHAEGPIFAMVKKVTYKRHSSDPMMKDLHHLVNSGKLKIVPVTYRLKNNGGGNVYDAFLWTGSAGHAETSSEKVFTRKNMQLKEMSFKRVTAICGGILQAKKVKSYTKPGGNSSGVTTTTASMVFQYKHVPAWLASSKTHIFDPLKSVKTTEALTASQAAKDAVQRIENSAYGENHKPHKAVNPKAMMPGKAQFQKENNGWKIAHIQIPALEAQFREAAMKMRGL